MTHPRYAELQQEMAEKVAELKRLRDGMIWQSKDERALADTCVYSLAILDEMKEIMAEMQRVSSPAEN